MITLYRYDPDTFMQTGQLTTSDTTLADLPGYTSKKPPALQAGKINVFDENKQSWKRNTAPHHDIKALRVDACITIDKVSESFRGSFNTTGILQLSIHREKYDEAVLFVKQKYPNNLIDFPYIQAESGTTGVTPKKLANRIIEKRKACVVANAVIEGFRKQAKMDVIKAKKQSDIELIVSKFSDQLVSTVT